MKRGMIVAPQPEAVEAGARAFMKGGNAVDAAVACALVQTVVDPQMCGIAGVGTMHLYLPGKKVHRFIDFYGRAPDLAMPDMWTHLIECENEGGFGFSIKGRLNDIGHQAVTKPGTLMALHEAATAHGRLPWKELFEPAVEQAEKGFVVRRHVHEWWTLPWDHGRALPAERLAYSADGRRIYLDENGQPKKPGTAIKNPDMARTLKRIAEHGIDIFYKGEIARAIAAEFQAKGGLLAYEDLANYRPDASEPLWGTYRGVRIATNPPPGGGTTVIQMLNILENFDLAALGHNSVEYIRVVSEAMKRASADRLQYVGDPKFVEVPVARLTDKAYARAHAEEIRNRKAFQVPTFDGISESSDTTHISAIDVDGNAVALTHTLGMPSGVIPAGLGIMFNGSMNLFDPRPGRATSIAPGKARPSSMAPSVLFRNGEPFLVIGAPGSAYITVAILQCILNVVDFGMTVTDAIAAPRFSATGNTIEIVNRVPRYVTDELERQGIAISRKHYSYGFAGVHAIAKENGRWKGAADPARDGMPLEV